MNIVDVLNEHQNVIDNLQNIITQIELAANCLYEAVHNKGTIFWIGNGGSAAACQHFSTELVCRYEKERLPVASLALTTDSSAITAISNDYAYDVIFARQIEALCRKDDVLVAISTSGQSPNIIKAVKLAKKKHIKVIAMTGRNGELLATLADITLRVDSSRTDRIQEAHLLIGHILCQYFDSMMELFNEDFC